MGISLPIGSHLDESEARRTGRQAEDYFANAGRRAGDEFSRQVNQGLGKVDTAKARAQAAGLERAFDRAKDAAGRLRVEEEKLKAVNALSNATDVQKISAAERVEKARRAEARAVREVTNELRDLQSASRAAISASESIGSLGAQWGKLGMGFGAYGAVEGVAVLGGAIGELSGLIGTLPGVIAGGVAAFGTLKLATLGFSDAIGDMNDPKKFAEDLKALSPNAQQAALAIQQMMPAFEGLKNATQDSLFSGAGQELNRLTNTYLPSIQSLTTSIAGSFNAMFKGISDELISPATQSALQGAMTNIKAAFDNLAPAVTPATQAIADLVNVSAGFLPGFAAAIADASSQFSSFITNASNTGELQQWIRDGINAFDQLAGTIPTVAQAISEFSGGGKQSIQEIVDAVNALSGALKVASGNLAGFRDMWPSVKDVAVGAINQINGPLNILIDGLNLIPGVNIAHVDMSSATTTAQDKLNAEMQRRRDARADAGLSPYSPTPGLTQMLLPAGGPTAPPDKDGFWWGHKPPTTPAFPTSPFAVPTVPAPGGTQKQPLPTVAASGKDPMSLLQGFPVTASLYSAAGSVLDNQQKVAQAKSDLNTLEKANVRDENAITAKRNELARAQREEHESELRLTEAKQQAVQKSLKGMQTASGELQQLGVQLDKDFGISKGLGGIVENAVKALGNILAAPFLQALGLVAKANPNEGSGLVGIAAANGAFGPQYTPSVIAASQLTGTVGTPPGYSFGSNADAAIALAQSANGGKYGWGASDLAHGLADCSGAVSDLVEVMKSGVSNPGRLFNTEDFPAYAAAHGWQRGLMPGALNVGVSHGGPGGGHMAATLPNGVNFESGGSHGGIAYGGPAAGAGDKQFTEQWYLPTNAGPVAPSFIPTPPSSGDLLPQLTPADIQGLPFSMPGAPPASGGAPLHPGIGPGNTLPGVAPLGPVAPAVGGGIPYPTQGGNSGNILGGMAMDGIMAATSGLDALAPGAGAAAKIGIQVLNRTVGYVAQNAGIAANAVGEFFSVGDNPKGSIGAGWFGKLAGGLAGAGMALPNIAGKKAPEQQQGQQGGNVDNSQTNHITVTPPSGTSADTQAAMVAEQTRMREIPGRQ